MRPFVVVAFLIAAVPACLAAPAAQIEIGPSVVHIGLDDPGYQHVHYCRHLREDCDYRRQMGERGSGACYRFHRDCADY
jgi:hypothetical protein